MTNSLISVNVERVDFMDYLMSDNWLLCQDVFRYAIKKIGWDSQQQRIDSFIYNNAFEWKKFKFVLSTTPIYFYTWTHIKWFRLMMSFYPIYRHTYYMLKSTN